MYGDLGLIMDDESVPPQKEKGFHDDNLKNVLNGSDQSIK